MISCNFLPRAFAKIISHPVSTCIHCFPLSYLHKTPPSFYQNNSFCHRRLSLTPHLHHTSVFNPQLCCSTTNCKWSTTKTWSVGTLLCWSVQCRASSGNTSPSRRGYKTPSSTYTQLRRAVSCPWRYLCTINAPAMPCAALSDYCSLWDKRPLDMVVYQTPQYSMAKNLKT